MSWIALDDVLAVIHHALVADDLRGPVNAVAPAPVTNAEFTSALGKVLRRPTIAPMPAFAARLAFGEVADALLLASQRAVPAKLRASGFAFAYGDLGRALRHVLGRVETSGEETAPLAAITPGPAAASGSGPGTAR